MDETSKILLDALKNANQICRSAYQIALRDGKDTNWEAFKAQCEKSLEIQMDVINNNIQRESA